MFKELGWLAILAAALAIYAIGFLIYGVLFDQVWMTLAGYTQESFAGQEWRMALSPVMPILLAAGTALLRVWTRPRGLWPALGVAALAWAVFLLPTRLYAFAYGLEPPGLTALDAAHLLLDLLAAMLVLELWPAGARKPRGGAAAGRLG